MTSPLFNTVTIGTIDLPNRVVMAPMTRCRSDQPGDAPNAMMAEYYAQRATAGMIISEATQITPEGKGYSFTPGIHSDAQIAGWKQVTDAVHAAGGRMVLQLWHVGRMSHESFHPDGLPVAPSAIAPNATVWIADPETGAGGMAECPVPRALETGEISRVIEDYRIAARNAKTAGFDGVEIHAANGYLIDEFLRTTSNQRDDIYGGSVENRIRFAVEVAEAVSAEMGAERTGIRFSPFITQRGMDDPEAPATILTLARELDRIGLAYIHLAEADWDDAPETPREFRIALRSTFSGSVIVAGGYDKEKAEAIVADGLVDAVAFGRPFIANPDLLRRFTEGLPLSDFDGDSLFGGDARGYTSYPSYGDGGTTAPLTDRDIAQARANDRIGTDLVSETQAMRVWHLRVGPGETLAAHRHDRPYFWTVLTDGRAQSRFGDGRIADITYRAGDTKHFSNLGPENGFVHDLTNTGEGELVFVTVEFNH